MDLDILTLRSREVPREVHHVEGCDCTGGGNMHATSCAIWRLPRDAAQAAVAAADRRLAEHTAELNRRLHAALADLAEHTEGAQP